MIESTDFVAVAASLLLLVVHSADGDEREYW